jgi:hypothetical protein
MALSRSPVLPLALLVLLPAFARADEPIPVAYDLQHGGYIIDSCLTCDRIPIQKPLRQGTFTVTERAPLPGAQAYDLLDIDLVSDDDAYRVKGTGTFSALVTNPPVWSLQLKVSINGSEEIDLAGKTESVPPWPLIDMLVEETAPTAGRDFSIRLIAAPVVPEAEYAMTKEGNYYFDCPPCMRPIIPIAATGQFRMGKVAENSLYSVWRIDGFSLSDAGGEGLLAIIGGGWYRQGGEVALTQQMGLRVQVLAPTDYPAWVDLYSAVTGTDVALPAIQIGGVADINPPSIGRVLTLTVSAKSSALIPFLRGDANADRKVDLSDGIYLLWWLFMGGTAPICAEAADANDDAKFDLSDALTIFAYLYQGGKPPPDPGPLTCGPDPTGDASTCLDSTCPR